MDNVKQGDLFENPKEWEDHWQDMPEYKQEDLSPYMTIKVHFRNDNDVSTFFSLINQKLSNALIAQNSVWFPEKVFFSSKDWGYIDES